MTGPTLATYAAAPGAAALRYHAEDACGSRNPWARDRDRIVHSTAFRRLNYKTQVFVYHEGDHYRSRLTHSLEVSQIARAMARRLGFHEDLTEALALAHDLGHPPFGHAGERALDHVMVEHGGFDHNIQTLRVVTELERLYAGFDGLNLTVDVIVGLAKHNGPLPRDDEARGLAFASLPSRVRAFGNQADIDWFDQASGEAQLAAIADDIAYNAHDLDDGLRAGLIDARDLEATRRTSRYIKAVHDQHGELEGGRMIYELKRRLITDLVDDAVREAEQRLQVANVHGPEDIKSAALPMVQFSAAVWDELTELRAFLFEKVYRHKDIVRMTDGAETIVRDLFARYRSDASSLPENWQSRVSAHDDEDAARIIADFVAGMTDRFAIAEHERLFDVTPDLR